MPFVITNDTSVYSTTPGVRAFEADGPDTLTINADAFLINSTAVGLSTVRLTTGKWTVTVNGTIGNYSNFSGILLADADTSLLSTINIGVEGDVYGGARGIQASHPVNINNKGTITGNAAAGIDMATAGSFKITNSGTITGGNHGIFFGGDGTHTLINSGSILGAVEAVGANGAERITNTGVLELAVSLGGGDDSVTNSRRMGVVDLGEGNNSLTNNKLGTMATVDAGAGADKIINHGRMHFVILGDGANTLTNTGYLADGLGAGSIAVSGGTGSDIVINSGKGVIGGDINLGDGADVLTVSGSATVVGDISLGDQNDRYIHSSTAFIQSQIDLGAGNDTMVGGNTDGGLVVDGAGNDSYTFGKGITMFDAVAPGSGGIDVDTVNGGAGFDLYFANDASNNLRINLDAVQHGVADFAGLLTGVLAGRTGTGTDIGTDLITGFEQIVAGSGDDQIVGSKAYEYLSGELGADVLIGLGGSDTLIGGSGADMIVGGAGADLLLGGEPDVGGLDGNVDTFIYLALTDSGKTRATRDVIEGFEGAGVAGGDVIDLSALDGNGALAGDPAFSFLATPNSKFTGVQGQIRYLWSGGNTIIQLDTNADKRTDFSIELTGQHTLAASDFDLA